jgi:lipopolysaccharide export system protein LptA
MRKVLLATVAFAMLACAPGLYADEAVSAFAGEDLHISAKNMTSFQTAPQQQAIVLETNVKLVFGTHTLSSDKAVIWLDTVKTAFRGAEQIRYEATVYLRGDVSVKKTSKARTTQVSGTSLTEQDALISRFDVTGKVFATAASTVSRDPRGMEIYKEALVAMKGVNIMPSDGAYGKGPIAEVPTAGERPSLIESFFGSSPKETTPVSRPVKYPVNISGLGGAKPKIEYSKGPDGTVATVIGRFYIWQKLDDAGNLLELQANSAVIFFSSEDAKTGGDIGSISGRADIEAIYMGGDIVMTEGLRTIRCDEMFYDFTDRKAVAVNAEIRTFDLARGVPIYLRAQKVRQVAENRFRAENIVLTTSEFYRPQISVTASRVLVTDTTSVDSQAGRSRRNSYQAQIEDVKLRYYDTPFFLWPKLQSDAERPEMPLKSMSMSYDNTWGPSVETKWYLSRMLGLKQPEGTDNTFMLDYFGTRGVGTGVDINYSNKEYFGRLLGYMVSDNGTDDLGKRSDRRNLEPDKRVRGRLSFQHRQYLEDDWQLTTELGYLSDRNFLESYYRGEFDNGKEQETLIYAKNQRDNYAFSVLGKRRINDFQDQLEELPTVELHKTGESLMDESFTFYSDTELSGLRQRTGDRSSVRASDERFTFGVTRNEVDMPLALGEWKFVPFVAGTGAYDDRSGFSSRYARGEASSRPDRNNIGMGELGVRMSGEYWKLYPDVTSRLWDLNGLRHVVRPELSGTTYQETAVVYDQRDIVRVGLSQLLQTRRGPSDDQRTVDWMRLNTELVIVDNAAAESTGAPNRYVWSDPAAPMRSIGAPQIFNSDLGPVFTAFEDYGPKRTHLAGDYGWRVTDTTSVLSDGYYDTAAGRFEQYDIGMVHMRHSDLSYYLGTRYLRHVEVVDRGSNSVIGAITYTLDPRYTLVLAQQYDFEYGKTITSEITLLRKYHRAYCGLTFSSDESLDRQAVIISIWSEGAKELAIGSRRYMGLVGTPENQ